jgi:hypothetical protein
MDEMVNALTSGIGSELGRTIRLKYYDQKRRAFNHMLTSKWGEQESTLLCDLIALAVFYELIIVPLQGSLNFMEFTASFGVSQVRMGEYTVGTHHIQSAGSAVKQFFGILGEYQINSGALALGDMDTFLQNVSSLIIQ